MQMSKQCERGLCCLLPSLSESGAILWLLSRRAWPSLNQMCLVWMRARGTLCSLLHPALVGSGPLLVSVFPGVGMTHGYWLLGHCQFPGDFGHSEQSPRWPCVFIHRESRGCSNCMWTCWSLWCPWSLSPHTHHALTHQRRKVSHSLDV